MRPYNDARTHDSLRRELYAMRKVLLVIGIALLLAPVAIVGGYFAFQAYLGWLTAGAKRPLGGPRPPAART